MVITKLFRVWIQYTLYYQYICMMVYAVLLSRSYYVYKEICV